MAINVSKVKVLLRVYDVLNVLPVSPI